MCVATSSCALRLSRRSTQSTDTQKAQPRGGTAALLSDVGPSITSVLLGAVENACELSSGDKPLISTILFLAQKWGKIQEVCANPKRYHKKNCGS